MPSSLSSSEVHALLLEKFEALLNECDLIDTNEHTLDNMEAFFLDQGRKFIHDAFQLKLQERIEQTETTDEAKQCGKCKKKLESATAVQKR